MIFQDRNDAGVKLSALLSKYKNNPNAYVVGLPRGGIVIAYEVARALSLPLDFIMARKIGAPNNPEIALGAITDKGVTFRHGSSLGNSIG